MLPLLSRNYCTKRETDFYVTSAQRCELAPRPMKSSIHSRLKFTCGVSKASRHGNKVTLCAISRCVIRFAGVRDPLTITPGQIFIHVTSLLFPSFIAHQFPYPCVLFVLRSLSGNDRRPRPGGRRVGACTISGCTDLRVTMNDYTVFETTARS